MEIRTLFNRKKMKMEKRQSKARKTRREIAWLRNKEKESNSSRWKLDIPHILRAMALNY